MRTPFQGFRANPIRYSDFTFVTAIVNKNLHKGHSCILSCLIIFPSTTILLSIETCCINN